MTVEELRKIVHTSPFQPFTMHLADGKSVRVPHPDFIGIGGQGRSVIVISQDGTLWNLVDLLLVTDVEVEKQALATR
jgi:hypothetical protein